MYIFIVLGVIALIVMVPILIKKTNNAVKDTKKMEAAGPIIARLSTVAKDKLRQYGITEGYQDYSTAGYEYFEYKSKYNYEDNLHLIIDKETKQIASYQFIPFYFDPTKQYSELEHFMVHSYKDLVKVELNTNLGNITTTTVGTAVGTGSGGIGVGIGSSIGVSTQMVNTMTVDLYFKDGETASCNFLNNMSVNMGGTYYNQALANAKVLLNICEMIIKENEKIAD